MFILLASATVFPLFKVPQVFAYVDATTVSYELSIPRTNYAAVALSDGTIVVTGGFIDDSSCGSSSSDPCATDTVEVIDPSTGSVTLLSDTLSEGKAYHSAITIYEDGTQKVLICGGYSYDLPYGSSKTCDIYDPTATTKVYATDNMSKYRAEFTLTSLPGGYVLAAGGFQLGGTAQVVMEVYDIAKGTWSSMTNNMNQRRHNHTATLVTDGSGNIFVVIAGGYNNTDGELDSIEVIDVDESSIKSSTITEVAILNHERQDFSANVLSDGTIIFIGGKNTSEGVLNSAEIYDINDPTVVTDLTTSSPSSTLFLSGGRYGHATTLLHGKIVIAGGLDCTGTPTGSVEFFNETTGTFTAAYNGSSLEELDTAVSGVGNAGSAAGLFIIDTDKALLLGGSTTGDEDGATAVIQSVDI